MPHAVVPSSPDTAQARGRAGRAAVAAVTPTARVAATGRGSRAAVRHVEASVGREGGASEASPAAQARAHERPQGTARLRTPPLGAHSLAWHCPGLETLLAAESYPHTALSYAWATWQARHESQVVLLELERRAAVEALKETVRAEREREERHRVELAAVEESIKHSAQAMETCVATPRRGLRSLPTSAGA